MPYIFIEGERVSFDQAVACVTEQAPVRGYDPDEAVDMLTAAIQGSEDFLDQLAGDFSIEVLA